ncbi:hypothetical protein GCM10027199_32940 [Amycolatopsis magusensis]
MRIGRIDCVSRGRRVRNMFAERRLGHSAVASPARTQAPRPNAKPLRSGMGFARSVVEFDCPNVELGCSNVELGCLNVGFGCLNVGFGCLNVGFGCLNVGFGCGSVGFGCGRGKPPG